MRTLVLRKYSSNSWIRSSGKCYHTHRIHRRYSPFRLPFVPFDRRPTCWALLLFLRGYKKMDWCVYKGQNNKSFVSCLNDGKRSSPLMNSTSNKTEFTFYFKLNALLFLSYVKKRTNGGIHCMQIDQRASRIADSKFDARIAKSIKNLF